MSTTPPATFGDLRALLHRTDAPELRWHTLLFMLEDARVAGWLDEALPYAEDHLRAWPDTIRKIPRWWWPRLVAGEPLAGWSLARAVYWNGWEPPRGLDTSGLLDALGALEHLRELELLVPAEEVEALWSALPRQAPALRTLTIRTTAHRLQRLDLDPIALPALERLDLFLPIPARLSLDGMPRLQALTLSGRGADAHKTLHTAPPTLERLTVLHTQEGLHTLIDHPVSAQLKHLSCRGVMLDTPQLARLSWLAQRLETLELSHVYSALPEDDLLDTLTRLPSLNLGLTLAQGFSSLSRRGGRLIAAQLQHDAELARHHARQPITMDEDAFCAFIDAGGLRPHGALLWTEDHANISRLRPVLAHLATSAELAHVHTLLLTTGDPMPADALLAVLDSPHAHALRTLILGEEAATPEVIAQVLHHPRFGQLDRVILANLSATPALLHLIAEAPHPERVQLTSWRLDGTEHAHMSWSADGLAHALALGHEDIFGGEVEVFFPDAPGRARPEHADALRGLIESPHMAHVHTLKLHGASPHWALDALALRAPEQIHTLHLQTCAADAPIHALHQLTGLRDLSLGAPSLDARASWLCALLSGPLGPQLQALRITTFGMPWNTPWPTAALRLALYDAPTTDALKAQVVGGYA